MIANSCTSSAREKPPKRQGNCFDRGAFRGLGTLRGLGAFRGLDAFRRLGAFRALDAFRRLGAFRGTFRSLGAICAKEPNEILRISADNEITL
eukprot:symbB.v1.2.041669.t1/scaffold8475.1/size6196/1